MRIDKWIVLSILTVFLALPLVASAHDGGDCSKDKWSQEGEHHRMLSDEKRQLLHQTMKAVFEKDKGSIEQMHKLHEKLHGVLAAGTFDQQAFLSTSAQIEKIHEKIHRDRVQAFASIASQFTPEERARIGKFLGHHHHHHHGHDGAWHHDGEGHDHSMNEDNSAMPQRDSYPPYNLK